MEKNNYVAITYTTNGYVNFTHNLLCSIEKNNIDIEIKVYALDKKASGYFKTNGIETIDFKSKYIESQDDMFFQNSDNFGYLMMYSSWFSSEVFFDVISDLIVNYGLLKSINGDVEKL